MRASAEIIDRKPVSGSGPEARVGVVLLHWGGPDAPGNVDAFLQNVYEDPATVRLPGGQLFRPHFSRAAWAIQRKAIRKQFDAVGGCAPAIGFANEQARGLESLLQNKMRRLEGVSCTTYVSMQYWHPFAAETACELERDNISHVVLVPGFLQQFKAGSPKAIERWDALASSGGMPARSISQVEGFASNPRILRAVCERVRQALQRFPRYSRDSVTVVFAATGVPRRDETDYYRQVQRMADIVMGLRGQSAPAQVAFYGYFGPINGPGPELKRKIEALARRGVRNVLVVPLCSITDTLHTTHYLDMACRKIATRAGICQYEVAQALNSHRLFLEALADLVLECLDVTSRELEVLT